METRIKVQRTASSKHYPGKASYRAKFLRVHKKNLEFLSQRIETKHGGNNGRPGRSCWGEAGEGDSLSQR